MGKETEHNPINCTAFMQAPLQKMKYIFPVPNHHTYKCTLD